MTVFRAEARAGFAAARPTAHATVKGIADCGPPLHLLDICESWHVGRDEMIRAGSRLYMHPSTLMRLMKRDLYTRHMTGSLEAERDRRWAAKRGATPRHPRVP